MDQHEGTRLARACALSPSLFARAAQERTLMELLDPGSSGAHPDFPREALLRQLGATLNLGAASKWLSLEECIAKRPPAARGFVDALDALILDWQNADVEVVVGPAHWLPQLFTRLPPSPPGSVAQLGAPRAGTWPHLSLVIATGAGDAAFLPLVGACLARRTWRPRVLAGYSTPEGALVGLALDGESGVYTLLPDAGVFFEFFPATRGTDERVPLWRIECGVTYELCVSTAEGLGRRTGRQVSFLRRAPYEFVVGGPDRGAGARSPERRAAWLS